MSVNSNLSGVIAPVLTPFCDDGTPDSERFVEHCEWLLDEGCTALAPFGTTSEGPSLGLDERIELLEALVDAGIDPARLMPGTGAASLSDAIMLTDHAVDIGCGGVLVLPPYYYKAPSDEGIYRFYSELIEEIGDHRLKVFLYHIPQMTNVAITPEIVARLVAAFPEEIAGLKDSSGDMANTRILLERFPDIAIFPASESFLLEGIERGAAGCISATANVAAREIRALYDSAGKPEAAALQKTVGALRAAIQQVPLIPGLKALVAHYRRDPQWLVVRPPLVEMEPDVQRAFVERLDQEHGFRLLFEAVT